MIDQRRMTIPEAERLARQLRREFAVRLAEVVAPRAMASKRKPTAYWLDHRDCLNHATALTFRRPHREDPAEPLILRISINYYAVDEPAGIVRRMLGVRRREETPFFRLPGWSFELSVLPEEALDFVPWVMFLAWAHETGQTRFLKPPHPCHVWGGDDDLLERNYAWTRTAWEVIDAHDRKRRQKKERRHEQRAEA